MLTVGFGVQGLFCGPVFQASGETGVQRDSATYPKSHFHSVRSPPGEFTPSNLTQTMTTGT